MSTSMGFGTISKPSATLTRVDSTTEFRIIAAFCGWNGTGWTYAWLSAVRQCICAQYACYWRI